jgi:hypothetical protein
MDDLIGFSQKYLNSQRQILNEMAGIKNARRAQVLSGETITAFFIFSLVLVYMFFLWDTTTRNIIVSESLHEMDKVGTDTMEKLLRTSGAPDDWIEKSLYNISAIGLANESRTLDRGKVLRFIYLMDSSTYDNLCEDPLMSNYDCSRILLGMRKYDFYFTMMDINGSILNLEGRNCTTGRVPAGEDYMITIKRSAMLDDNIVKISFVIWT